MPVGGAYGAGGPDCACVLQPSVKFCASRTALWSDSKVVLRYIANNSKRFHTFIANRVAEIRDATEPCQWRHVPSQLNPSDDCSRGLMASDLTRDSRWIRGPDFLGSLKSSGHQSNRRRPC